MAICSRASHRSLAGNARRRLSLWPTLPRSTRVLGVYAAQGYGSLFGYCTQALRLSEDAACNRIEAARACRSFPVILDLLASGVLSLTTVRVLRRHLTSKNHEAILARAQGRTRHEIDVLVAELAPQPDAPPSVRKLPTASANGLTSMPSLPVLTETMAPAMLSPISGPSHVAHPATSPPIVQATAPERYRVQFTICQDAHEKLRRVQRCSAERFRTAIPARSSSVP